MRERIYCCECKSGSQLIGSREEHLKFHYFSPLFGKHFVARKRHFYSLHRTYYLGSDFHFYDYVLRPLLIGWGGPSTNRNRLKIKCPVDYRAYLRYLPSEACVGQLPHNFIFSRMRVFFCYGRSHHFIRIVFNFRTTKKTEPSGILEGCAIFYTYNK